MLIVRKTNANGTVRTRGCIGCLPIPGCITVVGLVLSLVLFAAMT